MTCRQVRIKPVMGDPTQGTLGYRDTDRAFHFTPTDPASLRSRVGDSGTASLSFGTVQLEIAVDTGLCLFAWGYCPRESWEVGSAAGLPRPVRTPAAIEEPELEPHVTISVLGPTEVDSVFDPERSVLLLYGIDRAPAAHAIEVADGVVILLTAEWHIGGLVLAPTDIEGECA